jgi:hypothetical protein
MLFVNDAEVVTLPDTNQSKQFWIKSKEEIQQKNDYVCIRKYESESKFLFNDNGVRLRPSIQTVPYKVIVNSTRGQETWIYAEDRSKNKSEKWNYKPSHLFVSDEVQLDPQVEAEKVFIMSILGGAAKAGCYIFDPLQEASEKAAKMGGDELDVRFLIYKDPDLTEDDLILVSQAWGLNDAEKVDPTILRNRLYDTVTASEKNISTTTRGYKQFVTDVRNMRTPKLRERVEDRAIINKAVVDKLVRFDKNDRRWYYTSGGDYICQVKSDMLDRKVDILLEHFHRKSDEFDSLKIEVWGDKLKPVYSVADIDKMNTDKELRTAAKNMGVKLPINIKPENARKILHESLVS